MNKPQPPRSPYEIDRDLQRLRSEYDQHLAFGKWGSMAAIALFLLIFAVQVAAIVWLVGRLGSLTPL